MLKKTKKFAEGFTIVEVLVSLAVMAILLAAVAVAFNASIINYQENDDIFKAINSARQALTRMTTQLRTANPEFGAVNLLDPNNRCSLHTATNENITYEFRAASDPEYPNTLLLITNNNGNKYVLCNNVTDVTFVKTPDGHGDCKSVQISITVAAGDIQRTLSAAAVIRRNLN
jgi:prepilin-type N-terminal cleavage/methylation domain-containing protein